MSSSWGLLVVPVALAMLGEGNAALTTVPGASIAGGLFHTCMILGDNSLVCFGGGSSEVVSTLSPTLSVIVGFGAHGQLGSGNNETYGDEADEMGSELPRVDLAGRGAQGVCAGQSHTCVLLDSGEVTCWGFNLYGQLGIGSTASRGLDPSDMGEGLIMVDLGSNKTAVDVGCGQHHSCAVLDDGSVKCWGRNEGRLGLGDTLDRGDEPDEMGDNLDAVDLGLGRKALFVAGGRHHTCALLDGGGVKCWGGGADTEHNNGQLGQENNTDIGVEPGQMGDNLPDIDFGQDRRVVAMDVGWSHTCVILDDGTLRCIGRNYDGQLGLGDEEDRGDEVGEMGDNLPAVNLGTGRTAVGITCGRWHTCVLLDDATVKCFGVNTSDDLGAGQLGLEDMFNRGETPESMGDGLETVDLGIGRTPVWVRSIFDHNCVVFSDGATKCWGLNASGQLGVGDTSDRGSTEGTMGTMLPGLLLDRVACPAWVEEPFPVFTDDDDDDGGGDGGGLNNGLSEVWTVAVSLLVVAAGVCIVGSACLWFRLRVDKQQREGQDDFGTMHSSGRAVLTTSSLDEEEAALVVGGKTKTAVATSMSTSGRKPRVVTFPSDARSSPVLSRNSSQMSSMTGRAAQAAAAGTAAAVIAGGMATGWNVVGVLAENLPWVAVAYHMLNEIADMVDTRNNMQGNMEKIRRWALSLQDVILQMGKHIKERPTLSAKSLEVMSAEVISNLQALIDTVASYNQKGTLAQYASSRSCQKAVDAADVALRGALTKLAVGQGAELMSMVGNLQDAGLVVDEKLDMIIEHLQKQEKQTAALETRLALYNESIAEALGQFIVTRSGSSGSVASSEVNTKTLRELGKAQLDKMQISKNAITFPSERPFASGSHSQVYQVVHEGVVKAAKVTNLRRLGLGDKDVDRVFGRFVKELYILSQMHSERVVSVYGAIASSTELTLVMEYAERGSLRAVLDDEEHREELMNTEGAKDQLILDMAEGMAYLYNAGVEHRDLKSANCLVTHDWRAKISDFGLSKTTETISTVSATSSQFQGGTMLYTAPELMPGGAGGRRETPAELSDVFSYGVILWEVLCSNGALPWSGISPDALPFTLKLGKRLKIPSRCARFYRKLMLNCWRDDPLRRPKFTRILQALKTNAARSRGEKLFSRPSPSSPGLDVTESSGPTGGGIPLSRPDLKRRETSDGVTRLRPGSFEAQRSTTPTRPGQANNTYGSSGNPMVCSTGGRGRNPRRVGSVNLRPRTDGDRADAVQSGVSVRRPRSASPCLSSRADVHTEHSIRAWHAHRRLSSFSSERQGDDGSEAARFSLGWSGSSGSTDNRELSRNLNSSGRGRNTRKSPAPPAGQNKSVADTEEKSNLTAQSIAEPSGIEGDSGSGGGSGGDAAVFGAPTRNPTRQGYLNQAESASTVAAAKGYDPVASVSSVPSTHSPLSDRSFSPPTSFPPLIPTKGEGDGYIAPSPVTSDAPRHESTPTMMMPFSSSASEASSLQSFRPSQPGSSPTVAAAASPSSAAKRGGVSLVSTVASKSSPPDFQTVYSPCPTTSAVAESSAGRSTRNVTATQRERPAHGDDGDAPSVASPGSAKRPFTSVKTESGLGCPSPHA